MFTYVAREYASYTISCMKCFFCGSPASKVVDKRDVQSVGEIRRRRECLKCHRRFTTYERVSNVLFYVLKRDGRKELFDRDKVKLGLTKALEKRPDLDKVSQLVDRIENKLRSKGQTEVSSKIVGRLVLTELKKIDKVAYLRFASVYRGFSELGDFTRELKGLN